VGHFVQPEFLETTNARRYVEWAGNCWN
jgi:hypothetical protein